MKLEKAMKRYYRAKLAGTRPSEITQPGPGRGLMTVLTRAVCSDAMLNAAVHSAIAAVLIFGVFQYRQESVLAGVLSRRAADLSLDKYLDSRLQSLSKEIRIIRESY